MDGLMMHYDLTLPAMMKRAETLYGRKEIVTRNPDKSFHRHTYADFIRRAKQLSLALRDLGLGDGDRVATLAWNHYRHLEAYFGIPAAGAVLHTLNLRLHPDDLAYIVDHAGDRALLVDESLLPLLEKFRGRVNLEHVVVIGAGGDTPEGMLDYEELIASADAESFEYPDLDEDRAAAMCYTSGTTGRPKGVVYSHRAIALHSFGHTMADSLAVRESDAVLPVVPMFHANAWGLPFSATMVGAKQVFPGPHLDPASLLEDFEQEKVTITAGIPTIWLGLLQTLDKEPGAYDLSSLRAMLVGGSAPPKAMIRGFAERHGLEVLQGWGMTETTPLCTVARLKSELETANAEDRYDYMSKQGFALPFVEVRARSDEGFVPWNGESMGELEVRGPWVAGAYYEDSASRDSFTEDGWLRTGDIATIDEHGYVEVKDRTKDLVKSGGEWISSVALENALMGHDAVAEAAVIAIPDDRWGERPLAAVALKEDREATPGELIGYLEGDFPKWHLPDAVEFVDAIPRTSTGKFMKMKLREQFEGYEPAGRQPSSRSRT